jgi:hypothetical protein
MVGSYFFIATAVSTQRFAEGQVYIQTNTPALILRMELLPESGCPLLYINVIVPEGNRWVTGITGNRHIVFMQQGRVNCHKRDVEAKLPVKKKGLADLL